MATLFSDDEYSAERHTSFHYNDDDEHERIRLPSHRSGEAGDNLRRWAMGAMGDDEIRWPEAEALGGRIAVAERRMFQLDLVTFCAFPPCSIH